MIRYLKIRHDRIAEALDLDIMAVVGTYRNAVIDYIRDQEHDLSDLCLKLRLLFFKLGEARSALGDLFLHFFRLGALTVCHKNAYLL